ncbi:low temperature requirement A [Calothrix sp. NIES-4071]|nr:low temperature requirement A [Calothrix sp. NIES-4071]BAZ62130.1 low temperature requirement A [Calothrix sp. NIES-4105]
MANILEPPRLRTSEEESERRATWLELFYDLVFVVAVSQLAHNLKEDISISGFLGFVFLFIPVWWSWIGTTMYANRFDSDDIGRRLLVGLQMLTAAAMAVNIHHGLTENSTGFATSYALSRIVLVIEYVRAGSYIPEARPLTTRYAAGFAIAAIIWLISDFVVLPWRFAVWGIGIVVDLVTPFTARKYQLKLLPHASHLPERFGLFTMIVLGEAIIAVVDGVSEQRWDIYSTMGAVLALTTAFSLWWVYFDNLGGTPIVAAKSEGRVRKMLLWLYTHFPLVIGIAAAGVGVEEVLLSEQTQPLPDKIRYLMCGSVALCWLALAILHRTGVIRYCKMRAKYRLCGAVAATALLFFGKGLLPVVVIGIIAGIAIFQVVQDLTGARPTTRIADADV